MHSTIKQILWANDIMTWCTKQRPALTFEVAVKRLAWVKEQKNWSAKQFYNIMWSDECSAKQGKDKEWQWLLWVHNETDAQLIISKYKKNTMKRKRKASYRSEKIMCFSLRVLVSN